jgi:drug/metabolite transporter (DMT)-like permease
MQRFFQNNTRHLTILIAAFASVYILWGSTYLAIKYAIETLPPFLMAGSRFVFAGAVLMIWARFSKDYESPKAVHWKTSFIVGTFLLLGGNGGVVFAQHYISSSLAALLVATEPFWIVLLSWLWLGKSRPNLKTIAGIAVGFFGVWMLLTGQPVNNSVQSGSMQFFGSLAVILAAMSWATGSIYGLRAPVPKSSLLTAGMQMLSGGLVMLAVSLVTGEMARFDINQVSANSIYGLIYLIICGSLIGFTAYSWLLKNANPAMVSTYAYINPVVAVFLGWLIAGESFTSQMLFGAAVIVGSVVLITSRDDEDKGSPERTEIHESNMPKGTLSASA